MEELRKALVTTTSSGQALLPEDLEPAILEYLQYQSPLFRLMERGKAASKTHEFTVRTAIPNAWFEGELTPNNFQASTYERKSVQLKILRVWGRVSGFAQRMTEEFVNALETEVIGSMESFADLFEFGVMYGNDVDAYQFSGLDTYIAEDTTAQKSVDLGGNVVDVNAVLTLDDMDAMLDAVEKYRGTEQDRKVFIASPQMISKISGLQTKINREVQMIEFEGGFRMATYRGVPLLPSSFVRPAATTTSPTVTATAAAGGSLADDEYFYVISSVTNYGEQIAGVEDSATTATTNNSVTLTWTADANAKLYKIYRGLSTGVWTLLDTIAAKTYDGEGTVSANVATYTDDGSKTPVSAIVPLESGEENIFLANLDVRRGASVLGNISPLGTPQENFLSYIPLATTRSSYDYMIESFMAVKLPYAHLHAVARRVRTA